MIANLLDPVILFFLFGLIAGLIKSDLRLPGVIYETLSIYLLVAIGLKGGVQLAQVEFNDVIVPAIGTILLGILLPLIAYPVLRKLGKFSRPDAAAIAAHYGSVSAVTYAVILSYLTRIAVEFEGYTTILLVLMEIPAIVIGILIARLRVRRGPVRWKPLVHEVFTGKSVFLLIAGLIIGFVSGPERIEVVRMVFFDPFYGALAFFLLEMGIVTSHRLGDLRKVGPFLVAFGILMPIFSGVLGTVFGLIAGLTVGGTTILATLAASASYIAAPAAMRIAVPESNPTLYLVASLGITFPFNIVFGIPIYYWMAKLIHSI